MKSIAQRIIRTGAAALALAIACTASVAHAQAWPTKPVRWILPSAAGSAPDVVARLLGDRLSTVWGQQVLIDNRPGAAGNIAAVATRNSTPDGYTYFFAQASTMAVNPFTFKSIPFDPDKDFAGVITIGLSPFMFGLNTALPITSVPELIAYAKANPGKLSFATSASRNLSHISGELLKGVAGIDMLHVPYKGSPQAAQDAISGQVQIFIDSIPTMSAHIQSGRLRVVGVTSPKRVPGYESIPTFAETLPGFSAVGWFALLAPAATPRDAINRVNKDINAVLAIPEIAQRMHTLGMFDGGGTPEGLDSFLRTERAKWQRVIRDAKFELE